MYKDKYIGGSGCAFYFGTCRSKKYNNIKVKAIQISAERQMGVVDIPEVEMKSNEVLLRLEYVGFCGSDLNTW